MNVQTGSKPRRTTHRNFLTQQPHHPQQGSVCRDTKKCNNKDKHIINNSNHTISHPHVYLVLVRNIFIQGLSKENLIPRCVFVFFGSCNSKLTKSVELDHVDYQGSRCPSCCAPAGLFSVLQNTSKPETSRPRRTRHRKCQTDGYRSCLVNVLGTQADASHSERWLTVFSFRLQFRSYHRTERAP